MKVLVIGDSHSIHIANFIKVVLGNVQNVEITIFDLNSHGIVNEKNQKFYQENGIKLIENNTFNEIVEGKIIRKIPHVRALYHMMVVNKKLKEVGEFDYCLLHFIDITKVKLVLNNRHRYKRIIPVFWGSDLLRNKRIESNDYKKLFQISHKIICNTENMRQTFEKIYKKEFETKTEVIKFPIMSFQKIDQLRMNNQHENIRRTYGIPDNKRIVICGHSANTGEQYEKLIESLSSCHENVKNQCYFIFMMTYGNPNLREYQKKIKNLIKEYSLDAIVLCEYMEQQDLLNLFICSDVYITTITTDAFSGVMQEHLYAGSVVIYGKWLNYYEIEKSGIVAFPVEEVSSVGKVLEEVVTNYEEIQPKLKSNTERIASISSPESIQEMWEKKVFIG